MGLGEGICNHFSVEVRAARTFPDHPQGLHWSEVTPADLVTVDASGRKLPQTRSRSDGVFFIHGAAHRSKPGAICVLHTHMPFATT